MSINLEQKFTETVKFSWDPKKVAEIPEEVKDTFTVELKKDAKTMRIPYKYLHYFCYSSLKSVGVRDEFASLVAQKLTDNDKWGVSTHGVNRLHAIYIKKIQQGIIEPNAIPTVKIDKAQGYVDGKNGLGFVVAHVCSTLAMALADTFTTSFVSAYNSNHYGTCRNWTSFIAGSGPYVAECGTNARPSVCPTNGAYPRLGTNPYATAINIGDNMMYSADCATSTKHNGNLEKYVKKNSDIPEGWVIKAETGKSITNSHEALKSVRQKIAGFTTLGGLGEMQGGHKGFCFSGSVEMLTSAVSLGTSSMGTSGLDKDGKPTPHLLSHFFRCLKLDTSFRNSKDSRAKAKSIIEDWKKTPTYTKDQTVYYPGEKEIIAQESNTDEKGGILLDVAMRGTIEKVQKEFGLKVISFKDL